MTQFKCKFRETKIGVPTVKIETSAAVDESGIRIGGRLIESIAGDDDVQLIRADQMVQGQMLTVEQQNAVVPIEVKKSIRS